MISDVVADQAGRTSTVSLVTAAGILEAVITAITFRRRPNWYGRSDSVVKCRRGIPEGTSGAGGSQLSGEGPGLDAAQNRGRHMFP